MAEYSARGIQTAYYNLGFEDNDDELIPIIKVNGESIILRTLTSLLTKFGVIRQHCIVESVVLKEGGKQIYLN